MKNLRLIPLLLMLILTASCEKEIPLDYRTVRPIYVAEVEMTADDITARLSTTRGVEEQRPDSGFVDHAVVTVRQEGTNWTDTLENRGRGRYALFYFAYPGKEYIVDIEIDGRHYQSSSTMHSMPQVNSFQLVWQDVLTEKMLFADLRLQDNPNENNYYFMHLYRNNVGYRWAIMDDRANPGAELQQLFSCTTKRQMDEGTDSDVLHNGDQLRMEVRSIDRRAYDYLYSLQLMDNSGTNPIANFSGGLLGYFSAFQQVTLQMPFHQDSIRTAAASETRR